LVPYPHGARLSALPGATLLCWPQAIKELPQTPRRFQRSFSLVCGLQRYDPFPNWQALFSKIFHPIRHLADCQEENFYGK